MDRWKGGWWIAGSVEGWKGRWWKGGRVEDGWGEAKVDGR